MLTIIGTKYQNFSFWCQPDRSDELKRIEHCGGKVINWNGQRVLGVLATSRSIGTLPLFYIGIYTYILYIILYFNGKWQGITT